MSPNQKTLVIVAHLDDEVLGAGCLIQKRALLHKVGVLCLHGRKYPLFDEKTSHFDDYAQACKAKGILGYHHLRTFPRIEGEPHQVGYYDTLNLIEQELEEFQPTEVVIPSPFDLNQDHRFLNDACRIALRPTAHTSVKRVLEAYSFNRVHTQPNWFLPHNLCTLNTKLEALKCYKSEIRVTPHPRSATSIRAQHEVWGGMCGFGFAEAYNLIYQVD